MVSWVVRPPPRVLSRSWRHKLRDEPGLYFLARPRSLTQEGEAGLYRWVILETADRDSAGHFAPTMAFHELLDDGFQRDAVQGIAGMGGR